MEFDAGFLIVLCIVGLVAVGIDVLMSSEVNDED